MSSPVVGQNGVVQVAAGACGLRRVFCAAVGHAGMAQRGSLAVSLSKFRPSIYGYKRGGDASNQTRLLTSPATDASGCLVEFKGNPATAVVWFQEVGGGLLTPITTYTDDHGRAYALYQSGGYTGPVKITCLSSLTGIYTPITPVFQPDQIPGAPQVLTVFASGGSTITPFPRPIGTPVRPIFGSAPIVVNPTPVLVSTTTSAPTPVVVDATPVGLTSTTPSPPLSSLGLSRAYTYTHTTLIHV